MMKLIIDRTSSIPIYRQIARRIEDKILSQELASGFKLPAERRLAEDLSVHRNTVIKAYDVLITKGLVVVSRQKPKGYFVKTMRDIQPFRQRFFPLEKAFRYELCKEEKRFNDIFWSSAQEGIISFGCMAMDKTLDPVVGMESVVERIFDAGDMNDFFAETERFKENICGLLAEQNIYVTPKNVQILSETNQTLSYLITLYLREGDCIVAEEPMVPDNYSIFYNRGIRVIPVPMEEDGMRMDMLEEAIREHKPKFIYTLPNFHNPTGITMSLEKRRQLLKLADIYNVPIIEEDYQRDFSYGKNPPPSLYTLDTNKMVIYLYSFTLTFPYMMKLGFAVGPADLIDMLKYALSVDETVIGGIGQYFLNEYIDTGKYQHHVELLQKIYSSRLDLLCEELDKIADKGISYHKPAGGLTLWCTLADDISERALYRALDEKGVLIIPGWIFYTAGKKKEGHIRLCFSNVSDEEIRRGVKLLGEALDQCRQQKK